MLVLLMVPLLLQGLLTCVDEFFFHHKRGLPAWEVWGHPLDSLSVAAVYAIPVFNDYGPTAVKIFSVAAVFSGLFVTKDEFVHAKLCSPTEHWLHSLLFLLHPLSFLSAWVLWKDNLGINILRGQLFLVLCFMLYQIIYWGLRWQRHRKV